MAEHVLRLGARGSMLSVAQSTMVARAVEAAHQAVGLRVELVKVTTSGDKIQDRPLHEFGGKGLFTKELEQALLRGDVNFAVHSFKDVPVTMPLVDTTDLVIAATPAREDPRDVLVVGDSGGGARSIGDLPKGARVGTGSLRRAAQVRALRPDLQVLPIRGNIDTRVRKLQAGEFDAVLLALAGIKRGGLFDPASMFPVSFEDMLPAAGQGALALQCRRDDARTRELLAIMNHVATAEAVRLERAVVQHLDGDCHSPIAALAEVDGEHGGGAGGGGAVRMRVAVGGRDGIPPVVRAESSGRAESALGAVVAELDRQGAKRLLHG